MSNQYILKMPLVGNGGVGKTSFSLRYIDQNIYIKILKIVY